MERSFEGGMNKDFGVSKTQADSYFDAKNIQLVTDEGLSTLSVTNAEGNSALSVTDASDATMSYSRAGYVIVGVKSLREDFIVFYANTDDSGYGVIDRLVWNGDGTYTRVQLYKSTSLATNLGFYQNKKLQIEAKYRKPEEQKVYWSNEDLVLQSANVAPDGDAKLEASYDLQALPVSAFSRIPDSILTAPDFYAYTSGKLLNGVYQYAYRLVTEQGAFTSFSTASDLIPTSETIDANTTLILAGADSASTTDSGTGIIVRIDLSGIDKTLFTKLEVVSLYYESKLATPTIHIIEQLNVTDTVAITHIKPEAVFGVISYSEFLVESKNFTAASLSSKDGRLWAFNTKDFAFDVDFDARAYRANSSGNCAVLNNSVPKDIAKTGTWPNATYTIDGQPIADTADLVNSYNTDKSDGYSYQFNGSVLGGEGPNVMYSFTTTGHAIYGDIDEYNKPYVLGIKRGWKRGEIYRFGLVFHKNGQSTPVKWIGDIRIPDNDESGLTTSFYGFGNLIQINFLINTTPLQAYNYSCQLVYVPVQDEARRVVVEGVVSRATLNYFVADSGRVTPSPWVLSPKQIYYTDDDNHINNKVQNIPRVAAEPPVDNAWYPGNIDIYMLNDCVSIHSPEAAFFSTQNLTNTKLVINGYAPFLPSYKPDAARPFYFDQYANMKAANGIDAGLEVTFDVVDSARITSNTVGIPLTNKDNSTYVVGGSILLGDRRWHYGATACTIVTTDGVFSLPSFYDDKINSFLLGRLERTVTPYLGDSYVARQNSVYVPASDVSSGASILIADKGDTFISLFELTRITPRVDSSDGGTTMETITFPVESTINTFLRNDVTYSKGGGFFYDNKLNSGLIQERGNATGDLFKYDDVYSKYDNSKLFVVAPEEFEAEETNDVKIAYSEADDDTAINDKWLEFKALNYGEARSSCGPINESVEFNDELYIFQDTGFARLVINPRAVVTTTDGTETALGTGQVLADVEYITTEIGSQKDSEVIKSLQAIYWLDRYKKKLYKFTGQLESISDTKGIAGYLKKAITDGSRLIGIYDNKTTNVYMTVQDIEYEEVIEEEIVETEQVQEYLTPSTETVTSYSTSSATFTFSAVSIDSWLELTFNGTVCRFTAKAIASSTSTQFPIGATLADTTDNIAASIALRLGELGLFATYGVSVDRNLNSLTISSLTGGLAYSLSPKVFNNVLVTSASDVETGGVGGEEVVAATAVADNNTFVVVDFSTAGGVDRLDLLKNAATIAQSGCYQAGNYGYPDITATSPSIVDRNGNVVRELFRGSWDDEVTYLRGDLVIYAGVGYLSLVNANLGNDPTTSPTQWILTPTEGSFDTSDWSVDNVYENYLYRQAFIGTNSYLVGGEGVGSTIGLTPTRYEEYLLDGGLATNLWLGEEGEVIDLGGGNFAEIQDGVLNHYYTGAYPATGRGQRVWAKYNSGDTFGIKVMGAGNSTGWALSYFVVKFLESDISFTYTPSTETTYQYTAAVATPAIVTVENIVTHNYRVKTLLDNRFAVLSTSSGTNITHKITGLYDRYILSTNVDYVFNGGVFNVTSIDYANKTAYLKLIEGTPTLGSLDMGEYLMNRVPFTLGLNETLDKFIGFFSFIPTLYVKGVREFYTSNNDNTLYEHNSGNRCEYYGQYYDATIELVLPSKTVSEYYAMDFFLRVSKDSETIKNKTIHSIKVVSDKGETDEVFLYPRSETRYVKDDEGTRIPNNGVTTGTKPYSILYNIQQNGNSIWRVALPRVKEDSVFADRALGGVAFLRIKLSNGQDYRYVLDSINIKQSQQWD